MARRVVIAALLLAVVGGAAFAEVGVGLSVGYPLGPALVYDWGFEPDFLFVGAVARWKQGAFLLDTGVSGWLLSELRVMCLYLDLGACFDAGVFRFGIAGGIDVVRLSEPGYGSYSELGFNGKLNMDLKIGKVTVGLALLVPIDPLLAEEPGDRWTFLAAQPTLNVLYWFGTSSSKLR